mgnify:CR=1 FL=1
METGQYSPHRHYLQFGSLPYGEVELMETQLFDPSGLTHPFSSLPYGEVELMETRKDYDECQTPQEVASLRGSGINGN